MKPIEPDKGTASDLHAHACPWRIAKWLAVLTLVLVILPGLLTWGVYTLGMWLRGLDLDGLQTLLWWAYALIAVGLGALGWVLALGYWCIVVADCTQFMGLDGPVLTLDATGVTYRTRKVSLGPVCWQDIQSVTYVPYGGNEMGALIEFMLPPQHEWGRGPNKDWCNVRVHLLACDVDDIGSVLRQRLPMIEFTGWPTGGTRA